MVNFLAALLRAMGFLTRLPIANHWFPANHHISQDVLFFPIAGAIIGLIGGFGTIIMSWFGFDNWFSAIFGVFFVIVITGALHEDGLADVTDAFFVSKSKSDRLAIMKDSRIGTYGTLSIVFNVLFRIILLHSILSKSGLMIMLLAFIVSEACSRGGMVWFWTKLPLARENGTAAFAGHPDTKNAQQTLILTICIIIIAAFLHFGLFWMITTLLLTWLLISAFVLLCNNRIGGYTGDTLGAAQQFLAILLSATMCLSS